MLLRSWFWRYRNGLTRLARHFFHVFLATSAIPNASRIVHFRVRYFRPVTILMVETVAVLAFYERVSRLDVEGFTDDTGDSQRICESVDVGDAAAAAARHRQTTAATFSTAVVGRTFAFRFALITAGGGFFLDRWCCAVDRCPPLLVRGIFLRRLLPTVAAMMFVLLRLLFMRLMIGLVLFLLRLDSVRRIRFGRTVIRIACLVSFCEISESIIELGGSFVPGRRVGLFMFFIRKAPRFFRCVVAFPRRGVRIVLITRFCLFARRLESFPLCDDVIEHYFELNRGFFRLRLQKFQRLDKVRLQLSSSVTRHCFIETFKLVESNT